MTRAPVVATIVLLGLLVAVPSTGPQLFVPPGKAAPTLFGVAVAVGGAGAVAALRAHDRHRLRARLAAAEPPARHPPASVAPVLVLAGLAAAVVVIGAGVPAALVVTAALAAGGLRWVLRERSAHRQGRQRQLPLALDGLAASLRSGASLTTALRETGAALDPPLGPELAALACDAERGQPMRDVLDRWSAAHDDPGTRLAATALVLATVLGSTPARAVDGVAATVRERLDVSGERRALAAQSRASALVLSVAPVAFAVLLITADTAAAGFLLGSPLGSACLATGVALDVTGAWWMARLTGGDRW